MHTDASGTGWGATWAEAVPARGFHEGARRHLHINLLELGAVRLGLLSFVDFLKDPTTLVQLKTDSRVVMHFINSGSSRSKAVMHELRRLLAVCRALGVTLRAEYLPSAVNVWADRLSRATDSTGWTLCRRAFGRFEALYGPHTVDLFASAENAQCGRFFSRQAAPGSCGVDSLHQDWAGENGWCNPPFNLFGPVVRKIIHFNLSVTLVAPIWKAQAWWLAAMDACVAYHELPPHEGVFTHALWDTPAPKPKWGVAVFRFGAASATRCPA
eukprot:TRINITY_DN863_c0_g1_i10.p4 TRINITY_DN863_c0_g1~~TRINITY_DN863_c0_g1_i10.p4  ORF type:complete len:270 (-),score=31.96 TRINITY_DN863_c0_g1_i10:1693-2502(-)